MLPDRDQIFERIFVDHAMRGRTRVSWRLRPDACLPDGTVARIESARGPNAGPDEWRDCGPSGVDVRVLYHTHNSPDGGLFDAAPYYRVVLIPPDAQRRLAAPPFTPHGPTLASVGQGVIRSRPVATSGILDNRAWLKAREILRKEGLHFRLNHANVGWAFERRESGRVEGEGTGSPALDPLTGAAMAPWREASAGAEFLGGYRGPVPVRVLFDVSASEPKRDPERGLVNDEEQSRPARLIAFPPVRSNDLIVIDGTDERYNVGRVDTVAAIGGVALVFNADLKKYPLGSPVYSVAVPEVWSEGPPAGDCT